jgi:hypothetical protein
MIKNRWIIFLKIQIYLVGYVQQSVIDQFSLSRNPSLQLITDWIVRSGNSSLAVDMLLATMKQIGRDDLVEVISREREAQNSLPSVFISYQWDIQDEVKELRNFLELVGFTCWMDMGQIGGGELLYEKIDHGIRNAKVNYCISFFCFQTFSSGSNLLYDTDVYCFEYVSTWISSSWYA